MFTSGNQPCFVLRCVRPKQKTAPAHGSSKSGSVQYGIPYGPYLTIPHPLAHINPVLYVVSRLFSPFAARPPAAADNLELTALHQNVGRSLPGREGPRLQTLPLPQRPWVAVELPTSLKQIRILF